MSLTKMRRKMSKAIQPILYLFVGIFLVGCFAWYWPSMRNPVGATGAAQEEAVVARVDGQDVPRVLFERMAQISTRQLELQVQMQQRQGNPLQIDLHTYHLARGKAFEQIVDSYLKAEAAEREGIHVSNADVRGEINKMVSDELATKMEGATPQEKKQYEEQVRAVYDPDSVKRSLLMDRLDKALRERFKPAEADLMASYNEVKVRHILINTEHRTDADARKLAEQVLGKVKQGGDFAALAKQYSDDPMSKTKGGDVDWVTAQSNYVPEFTQAARQLKKGETSGLVRTMFGYHILKADDVRTKIPKDIKNAKKKQEYLDQFTEKTISDKMQSYMTALRLAAKIEPIDPWIAGYIAENKANSNPNNPAENAKLMAEAIQHYEEAAARGGLSAGPALEAKLAELYHTTKQEPKSLEHLNKALANSKTSDLLMMKGEIYEGMKDKKGAAATYVEASKSIPDSQPYLHLQLQQAFIRLGRKDLAAKEYGKWQQYLAQQQRRAPKLGAGGVTKVTPVPTPSE
jgi:foldase protein PrsA